MSWTVVLVCGGRTYNDEAHVGEVLSQMRAHYGNIIIVHGGCLSGADMFAHRWAYANGVHVAAVDALWRTHKRSAGPIRNSAMLALSPHVCVAFPGGPGTENMKKQAREAGVTTYEV